MGIVMEVGFVRGFGVDGVLLEVVFRDDVARESPLWN